MTRNDYLDAYERELRERYAWASNAEQLAQFIRTAREAIFKEKIPVWAPKGPAAQEAWRIIGGLGAVSMQKLRGLA